MTDNHLRVMTKSAAGPANSPMMNAASGGAAVSKLSCTSTICCHSYVISDTYTLYILDTVPPIYIVANYVATEAYQ